MGFRLKLYAIEIGDTSLLAKLSGNDLVSQEATYHIKCLSTMHNKARKLKTSQLHEKNNHNLHHGIASAKVCDYIEEVHMEKENPHFQMQDLAKMYEAFLKQ